MKIFVPLFSSVLFLSACVPGGGNGPDTVTKGSDLTNNYSGEFQALETGSDQKPSYCSTADFDHRTIDKRLRSGQTFIHQEAHLTSDGSYHADEGDIQTLYTSVDFDKNQFTKTMTRLDQENFWYTMTCKVIIEDKSTQTKCEPIEYSPTLKSLIDASTIVNSSTESKAIYFPSCYIRNTKGLNEDIPKITADSTQEEIDAIMKLHDENIEILEASLPKTEKGTYSFAQGPTVSAFKIVSKKIGDAKCYMGGEEEIEYKDVTAIETKIISAEVPTLNGSSCGGEEPIYSYREVLDKNGKRISFEKFELKEINL